MATVVLVLGSVAVLVAPVVAPVAIAIVVGREQSIDRPAATKAWALVRPRVRESTREAEKAMLGEGDINIVREDDKRHPAVAGCGREVE